MTVHMLRGHSVPYELNPANNWQPDLDNLRQQMSPRTKMIILCSPSNPTGSVLARENMQAVIDFARDNGIYVLSDEIYSDICFDGVAATSVSAFTCSQRPWLCS